MPAAMDDTNGSADHDVEHDHHESDDERMGEERTTYKSWKKKYRKMRITFDQKMHDCEDLHRQESLALATAKRIAIENDRILDLLADVNVSPQIPLDKRIDISQDPSSETAFSPLDVDKPAESSELQQPTKSLQALMKDVPHYTFSQAKEQSPSVVADMEPFAGEAHPPAFLTADDLDDYLHDVDKCIDPDHLLPTLAPSARSTAPLPETNPHALSQTIAVKNPTSVYNWLRKHAPKTFLQDAETTAPLDDENHHAASETPQTDGRKRRGGARGEGSRGGRGSRGGKRASLAASRAEKAAERAAEKAALAAQKAAAMREAADNWDAMDDEDDEEYAVATPVTSRGKRKRASTIKDDDDGGYRPRVSTGRPTKKKRKSESADVGTPTISKRVRKSEAARDRDE